MLLHTIDCMSGCSRPDVTPHWFVELLGDLTITTLATNQGSLGPTLQYKKTYFQLPESPPAGHYKESQFNFCTTLDILKCNFRGSLNSNNLNFSHKVKRDVKISCKDYNKMNGKHSSFCLSTILSRTELNGDC